MTRNLVIPTAAPDAALPRLLRALGAEFRTVTLESVVEATGGAGFVNAVLILSEDQLVTAAQAAASRHASVGAVLAGFSQVLIHPFSGRREGIAALGALAGAEFRLAEVPPGDRRYHVAGSRVICGAFAGLTFDAAGTDDRPLRVAPGTVEWLVTLGGAGLFGRFHAGDCEVFIHASTARFDLQAGHVRNLAAADCFSALAPILWFVRHARSPLTETGRPWANWIIDDPNLTLRYGWLRLPELATRVERCRAAVTIAFIPWNHHRTSPAAVNLVRTHWPALSICVHGCDHTRGEFATATPAEAHQLGALALSRMRTLAAETALGFERVMVFPQGKFSAGAMTALRHVDLVAAVNTELADARTGAGVPGVELLAPAVTAYGGLPMFLRRPADEPLANFALDLLLGRPCLIVTHHDYFAGGLDPFEARVAALNRLEPAMSWTTLEDGISTTAGWRLNQDRTADVRLYSPRTYVQLGGRAETIHFSKREPDTIGTLRVTLNGAATRWLRHGDEVTFTAAPPLASAVKVEVATASTPGTAAPPNGTVYRMKVAARRYLSEFRDNYVEPSPRMRTAVTAVRALARRG